MIDTKQYVLSTIIGCLFLLPACVRTTSESSRLPDSSTSNILPKELHDQVVSAASEDAKALFRELVIIYGWVMEYKTTNSKMPGGKPDLAIFADGQANIDILHRYRSLKFVDNLESITITFERVSARSDTPQTGTVTIGGKEIGN